MRILSEFLGKGSKLGISFRFIANLRRLEVGNICDDKENGLHMDHVCQPPDLSTIKTTSINFVKSLRHTAPVHGAINSPALNTYPPSSIN